MIDRFQRYQRRRRDPTTAPGRRNHGRVPFSRHPAQSMVMTGTGSWSEFEDIMSYVRTKPYLNSVGPLPADKQHNRHPGRGITTDHPSAAISPESSRPYAPVESSSRSDSSVSSARRSQVEVPSHARCAVQKIPENENGGPVLPCKPTPYLERQINTLTYLCVPGSASRRRHLT